MHFNIEKRSEEEFSYGFVLGQWLMLDDNPDPWNIRPLSTEEENIDLGFER